tara:strand:- start:63 stop:971 length:909 start_codon:yes stop_codon:yes gene_type:complete
MAIEVDGTNWELITRLNKDLRDSATLMGRREARYLVDLYYTVQDQRKRAASQGLAGENEPKSLTDWLFDQFRVLENDVKRSLAVYSLSAAPGQWAQSVHGIGPVIAAGLLAHIDVHPWKCKTPEVRGGKRKTCFEDKPHNNGLCGREPVHTAGGVWRFAGLDPTVKWEKKTRRPWNASLKRLAWIIGDSFCKQRNSPKDFYGKFYEQRKVEEVTKNQRGDFADQAAASLRERKIKDPDLKKTLESGMLPDGRIELRARRYAVKLFLSHYHHVAYVTEFGTLPPSPYAINVLGHAHYVAPPNW